MFGLNSRMTGSKSSAQSLRRIYNRPRRCSASRSHSSVREGARDVAGVRRRTGTCARSLSSARERGFIPWLAAISSPRPRHTTSGRGRAAGATSPRRQPMGAPTRARAPSRPAPASRYQKTRQPAELVATLLDVAVRWAVFDGFTRPVETRSTTWAGVSAWTAAIEAQLGTERDALAKQRASWDKILDDLGGDPTSRDWTSFLPLRRGREEDWSDWLAQLLEDSSTGRFAYALLGATEAEPVSSYVGPFVHREVLFEEYRADLVIEWADASYTHIEVKVGDPNLGKTLATAQAIARRFAHLRCRSDRVLLLPTQFDAWDCQPTDIRGWVHPLTWIDVALALRSTLSQSADEPAHWRVWAHTFCGAVEQDLLGMRSGRDADEWARSLSFLRLRLAARLLSRTGMTDA
jgi:hypothetical protein